MLGFSHLLYLVNHLLWKRDGHGLTASHKGVAALCVTANEKSVFVWSNRASFVTIAPQAVPPPSECEPHDAASNPVDDSHQIQALQLERPERKLRHNRHRGQQE